MAEVTFAATETVGIPTSVITYTQNPGTDFQVGLTTVTATATNAIGSDDCMFTVTVNDNIDPVITCPTTGLTVNVDADECDHTGTFEATATDNCGVASFAYSVGGSAITYPYDFPVGTTSVLAVVTDDNGQTANCSFCLLYTSPSPRDLSTSRMPSSA